MRKASVILTALFLTACVSNSQLDVPQRIQHNDKTYQLATQQDLGSVARYVYLLPGETPKEWQSAVEILLDRNFQNRTLQQRIDLRKRVYTNTGVKNFQLYSQDETLYAYVSYEPSEQNKDWQIDMAKGKELPFCGFVQYQYSQKVELKTFQRLSKVNIVKNLQKYLVAKESKTLQKADLSWKCESYFNH